MKTTIINHRDIFGIIDLRLEGEQALPKIDKGFFEIIEPTTYGYNITIVTNGKTRTKISDVSIATYKNSILPKIIQKCCIKDIACDIEITHEGDGGLIICGEAMYHGETFDFDIDTTTNIPATIQAARHILMNHLECPAHSFEFTLFTTPFILNVIENMWGKDTRDRVAGGENNSFHYIGTLWSDEVTSGNYHIDTYVDVYEYYGKLFLAPMHNGCVQDNLVTVNDDNEIFNILF